MTKTSGSANSWMPECWQDDEKMRGYMSMIKARHVNSVDYDRKVRFWRDTIAAYCAAEKNAVITLPILKNKFRRGDSIPSSLSTVLENMQGTGDVITLEDWREKHSSWVGWGVSRLSKTSSWLMGSKPSLETSKLIHIPTLHGQAEEAFQLYLDEFKSDVDCAGEVVSYAEFYGKGNRIFKTKENFDILLDLMVDRGDITVGVARNGEKILKFRDTSSDGPVRFTDADASVHNIRQALRNIERDVAKLEEKAKKLDDACRQAIRNGQKPKAAQLLRQKKIIEKNISDKDGQMQGLLTMLHQLSSTKLNKEVIDAYQMGTKAFKENLARHGLSPEKVDETLEEIATSMDDFKDIENALSQGFGTRNKDMDAELEQELNDLLRENEAEKEPELNLPSVPPRRGFGLNDDDADLRLERELEERLRRLREAV